MINRLNEFLIEQIREDNNVVLLIDEAQNLKPSVLEEVRMLSNLETETEKLIQIVLMGQPELKDILWMKKLTQLRQRVALYYHLKALSLEEMIEYVDHRLKVAGAKREEVFTFEALERVFELTQGVPRLVNSVCDRALLTAFVTETKPIAMQVIDEVAVELPALSERNSFEEKEKLITE